MHVFILKKLRLVGKEQNDVLIRNIINFFQSYLYNTFKLFQQIDEKLQFFYFKYFEYPLPCAMCLLLFLYEEHMIHLVEY